MITKLLLYCTKGKPYLLREDIDKDLVFIGTNKTDVTGKILNGKIVGECDYEVEEILYLTNNEDILSHHCYRCRFEDRINCDNFNKEDYSDYYTERSDDNHIIYKSKLTATQLHNYLKGKNGYAIHIKNLHIFDEPKELSDYYPRDIRAAITIATPAKNVRKAPQNMMRVFDWKGDNYVLISINPEWLCKILNGEKTIEIRKKVLKEML